MQRAREGENYPLVSFFAQKRWRILDYSLLLLRSSWNELMECFLFCLSSLFFVGFHIFCYYCWRWQKIKYGLTKYGQISSWGAEGTQQKTAAGSITSTKMTKTVVRSVGKTTKKSLIFTSEARFRTACAPKKIAFFYISETEMKEITSLCLLGCQMRSFWVIFQHCGSVVELPWKKDAPAISYYRDNKEGKRRFFLR